MLYSTWFDIKLVSKIAGGQQAAENTDHVPEGISLCILPVSPCGPSNPRAKMLSCAVSHPTVLRRPPSNQKVQNREAGSVAYRIYYSLPPTGSSFVALSRSFSSTLYSFSILSHVSSDKRQRDYLRAFKSPTEPSVSTAPPTDQQPPRATAEKRTVFQL